MPPVHPGGLGAPVIALQMLGDVEDALAGYRRALAPDCKEARLTIACKLRLRGDLAAL